jgi:hypothetical protein
MFLQLQGQNQELVAAIRRTDLDHPSISPAERALLAFAKLITQHAYRCQAEDTEKVRQAGWSDPQISPRSSVEIDFSVVLFPAPLPPSSATILPSGTVSDTPLSTRIT